MDKKVSERIRAAGFRATRPRVELLSYLTKQKYPQTILSIAEGLRGELDQVTVYRTVESFAKAGLVREVDLRLGRPAFEIADTHDHHHVVCVQCHRIEDFAGCGIAGLADVVLKKIRGFTTITGHSMEFFGVCRRCSTV